MDLPLLGLGKKASRVTSKGMREKAKHLYEYKDLLISLVSRELKVKYKRSIFGFFWSFLTPLILVVVYSIVFTQFMHVEIVPHGYKNSSFFGAYLMSSLLAWNYLANSLSFTVGSLVDSGPIIKKSYFPREIVPFSGTLANLVNYGIELLIISAFFLIIGNNFLVLLPVLLLVVAFQTLFIFGLTLLFSLINVYFRDMKHITSLIILIWFWACPIIYPYSMVANSKLMASKPWLLILYNANPMTAFARSYQKIFFYVQYPGSGLLTYMAVASIGVFGFAYLIFKRYEFDIASEV
jgi:lipopolysaccharide transport system permease protein